MKKISIYIVLVLIAVFAVKITLLQADVTGYYTSPYPNSLYVDFSDPGITYSVEVYVDSVLICTFDGITGSHQVVIGDAQICSYYFNSGTSYNWEVRQEDKSDPDNSINIASLSDSLLFGCTDSSAVNYEPTANANDGTCSYPPPDTPGCTDPAASNYNPSANIEDGSCIYPDVTPPTVELTYPVEGGFATGTLTMKATASDNVAVSGVSFYIDSGNVGSFTPSPGFSDTVPPYEMTVVMTNLSEGPHTAYASASDTSSNSADSTHVNFTVDYTAPTAPNSIALVSASDTGSSNSDGITSSTTPTFTVNSGCETSDFLRLKSGTTTLATIPCSDGGAEIAGAIPVGTHTISVTHIDAAGNESSAITTNVTIDTSASAPGTPTMYFGSDNGSSNSDGITNNPSPSFVVSCEEGANVMMYTVADDTVLNSGFATVCSGGSATVSSNLVFENGVHGVYAQQTDLAGNVSTTSSSFSFTIDTTAPAAPGAAPAFTPSFIAGFTNDTTPTFTGTCSADFVTLYDTATQVGTTTCSGGNYSVTSSVLSESLHSSMRVTQSDIAGNESTYSSVTSVRVDTTAPSVSVTAPLSSSIASGTISLTASASDTVGVYGVQFQVDGVNTGSEDTTSTYGITWDSSSVSDGSHSIRAISRDSAGNTATSSAVTVFVDNTPPSTPGTPDLVAGSDTGTSATDNTTTDTTPTFDIAVTCESSTSTVSLRESTTVLGSTSCSGGTVQITSSALSAGVHNIYAVQIDGAGLMSANATALSVTIDTTAPSVSITDPADEDTVEGTVSVTATASDGVSLYGVQFYLDEDVLGAEDLASAYSVSWDTTAVDDGEYDLYAVARDTAGNYATSSISVTVLNEEDEEEEVVEEEDVDDNEDNSSRRSGRRSRSSGSSSSSDSSSESTSTTDSTTTGSDTGSIPTSTTFVRDLTLDSVGEDVRALQVYLNTHNFPVSLSGIGSLGFETNYFGQLTQSALSQFQIANSIVPAIGYFGPITRGVINTLGW